MKSAVSGEEARSHSFFTTDGGALQDSPSRLLSHVWVRSEMARTDSVPWLAYTLSVESACPVCEGATTAAFTTWSGAWTSPVVETVGLDVGETIAALDAHAPSMPARTVIQRGFISDFTTHLQRATARCSRSSSPPGSPSEQSRCQPFGGVLLSADRPLDQLIERT